MRLVEADGGPVRPAKLWNETESASQSAALVEQLGPASWAREVGSVPVPAFTITKLAWMAAHEPQLLAAADAVLLPHDWLTTRLAGRRVTDRGDASGTGYWSPATDQWRPDLLAVVDGTIQGGDRFPEGLGPLEPAGRVGTAVARTLGVPGLAGAVVAPGTGDNMAAALGLGLHPGDLAVSLGTSGTVFAVSEEPTADPSGAVAGFADSSG